MMPSCKDLIRISNWIISTYSQINNCKRDFTFNCIMAAQRNMSISLSPLNERGIFPEFMTVVRGKRELLPDNRSHMQCKLQSLQLFPVKKERKNSLHGSLKNRRKNPKDFPKFAFDVSYQIDQGKKRKGE